MDYNYKYAKKTSHPEDAHKNQFRAVCYYVKNVGLSAYESVAMAAKAYGLKSVSVTASAQKSLKQTYEEFVNDKAVNKFIYADDEKVTQLIKEFGLI